MRKISQIWFNIQGFLFPFIEKEIEEPLTERLKQLVATLELIRIEDFVHIPEYWLGQSPKNRKQIARSFVAKAVYNMTTTRGLIDRLKTTPALRRICGWEKASQIPHEPLAETSIYIRNNCCIRLLCHYLELFRQLFLNSTKFCRFQRILIP